MLLLRNYFAFQAIIVFLSLSYCKGQAQSDISTAGIQEHNKYRVRHGSPNLSADSSLNKKAQDYADYLAANDKFEHSSSRGIGENLAANMASDKVAAMRYAVKQWYDEEKDYNYDNPGFSQKTGHFTAVVWKNTQRLGVGVAWNPKKRWWVVVANYSPAGNSGGRDQYAENVQRPR